ncbi:aldehyde dehydrogenase family protein [Rhodococcus sp. C3V]|uniref:aldehyde dehydrogenase family protein n=1 Tax=Rhodococcus sp. C3V TaxID=3034165 RepID=UPI0023E2034B|nr:aldehyde dehydrogenase family protein [Rhodococcus sp. C3V]MDF3319974.1 aldehyde dehydrogenase family protein [Rhodococcus sp. C3V]
MRSNTTDKIWKVVNPASGEEVGEVQVTSPETIDTVLDKAVSAQRRWAEFPRHRRAEIMNAYVDTVRERASEFAELLSREQGKPLSQAQGEVESHCRLFEGFARRVLAMEERATFLDIQPGLERDLQITRHEPLGVVVAIVPFNFPVELYAHKVAPALATGNAVVVKPAEDTPLTTLLLVEALHTAGVPEDVVKVVFGGAEVGNQLVSDDRVAAVSFTGSTETGIKVAQNGARTLKRTILEVGGNDAMIVLDDADLDLVVDHAVIGRTFANGQVCCATKRILAHGSIHDELLDRLATRFAALNVGDQLADGTEVGPLVNNAAALRIAEQVQLTTAQGGRVVTGGKQDGAYYFPTILAGVTAEMNVAQDMEIFGPVASLIRTDSDEEALKVANSTRYGLSGSVFTQDMQRAMAFATRLQSGQVVINNTGLYRPETMHFGNYQGTGGREGLTSSLEEFVQTKTISLPGILPAFQA